MGHRLTTYRESLSSQHSKISPHRAYLFLHKKISDSKRRISLFAVMAILLVSSILTAFSPLAEQASALSESEMNLSDKALSYSTLNALRLCVKDEGSQQADNTGFGITFYYINDDHAKSGNWWRNEGSGYWGTNDGASRTGSYLNPSTRSTNKGGDGQTLCSDILKTGIKLWGYSSALDLLCDAGIKRADGSACKEGTDRFGDITKYSDQIYNTVVKKVYGGKTPSLYNNSIKDYPGRYLLYSSAFTTGCVATPSASDAESRFVYTDVKVVGADGKITATRFVSGAAKGDSRPIYIDRDNLKEIKNSCSDIAAQMNKYAPAYAAYRKANLNEPVQSSVGVVCDQDQNQSGCDENLSTCIIEGVGWIVCPIMTFMGGIVDGAYNFVAGLLVVQPLVTTATAGDNDSNVGIYTAWSVMRNIANIAFVITFLIIIFSQLSGMGVSNYGVKKLLPRLVVAAILVNLSFWVCAIAVDLSNVVGASMIQVFDAVKNDVIRATDLDTIRDATLANGGKWSTLVSGVLAGGAVGAVYYVGLAALIPALLAAVVAILTVFLVLTLRQALIILLVVVSPLAFVAYLLPNTEDLFTKWRKLFTTLLLMYPIIAALFGASALASKIITDSAEGNAVVQIMGACIAILPLAITPLVMKTAGGLLNRFGGIVNNSERGPVDRLKKVGAAYGKQRQDLRNSRALGGAGQAGRGAFVRWRARRESISNNLSNEANRSKTEYVAGQFEDNARFRNAAAGASFGVEAPQSATQRALASAINIQTKLETDEVNAAKAVIEHANLSGEQRQELAMKGTVVVNSKDAGGNDIKDARGNIIQTTYSSEIMQKAAIQEQMRTGAYNQKNDIIASSGTKEMAKFRQSISQGIVSNGLVGNNPALGGKTIDDVAQGKIKSQTDLDVRILNSVNEGKFTAENLAGMHDNAREMAIRVVRDSGDANARKELKSAAQKISNSPELSVKIAGNRKASEQLIEINTL
jgi:hypothetical protein